ncbi:TIGR03086 family metal-binding protein [Actinomadura parmotrematis]|uniref:TIGR03086 family protein n=1 Tax=Actinomadura parmotrematis TaxID=2864039 RepID=A0ABS7G1Q5_9ACTN|nr:TIGR03086 family metal-binding protein [Actinomadura parmotrematis]MBW8486636.1 TIGR03086 family protein [Actinomadura parmotrematis]
MPIADPRPLDARAVRTCAALVAAAGSADPALPTPCAGWTLADLVGHLTAQHRGFAAAARGDGADLAHWAVRPGDDHAAAAEDVIAAFADDGVLDRDLDLPEFGPGARFPGALAVSFHFIDYVVHGWDVARTLGLPYTLDDDLAAPALEVALAVPGGDFRTAPGAAFAPERPAEPGAGALDRILAHLGRSPGWTAPQNG